MDRSGRVVVVVLDRHVLFVECLGLVLETRRYDCRSLGVPAGGGATPYLCSRLLSVRPDVALINADLAHYGGPSLVGTAARAGIAVAVLTDLVDESRWGEYLQSGAQIVVPKSASLSAMASLIRRMSRGDPVLDRRERARLIELSARRAAEIRDVHRRLDRLSAQERDVLRHLMAGATVREIASARVVSDWTVRTQVKAVLSKLEVSSQLAAVAQAHLVHWRG